MINVLKIFGKKLLTLFCLFLLLLQRTSLRSALQDAQNLLKAANESATKYEKECMELVY